MDDIEKTLSEVSLETPSQALDEKMDDLFREAHAQHESPTRHSLGIWQVAAACLCCTLIGFTASHVFNGSHEPPQQESLIDEMPPENHYTTIYIFESPEQALPQHTKPAYDKSIWDHPMETKVFVTDKPIISLPQNEEFMKVREFDSTTMGENNGEIL